MKNWKLGTKLIGGFILTTLLILIVGLLSIFEQDKLTEQVRFIAQEVDPASSNALDIKWGITRINALVGDLLNPYVGKQERIAIRNEISEVRKRYTEASAIFSSLDLAKTVDNEWRTFLAANERNAKANNQILAESKILEDRDMTTPYRIRNAFATFEREHRVLINKVGGSILTSTLFDGGTSDRDCGFGKWLRSVDSANPEIIAMANSIRPLHTKVHELVGEIKKRVGRGEIDQAAKIFTTQLQPIVSQVFDELGKGQGEIEKAIDVFRAMSILSLSDRNQAINEASVAIEKIVKKIETIAADSVKDAQAISSRGRIATIVCMVMGVILALGLGFFLTRLITAPLFKGVGLAKAMADGDLTRTMDVDQEDEIGVLAKALNEMAATLRKMFSQIQSGMGDMDKASAQLTAISAQMTSQTESTANRSGQVAAAAEQMSGNQTTIAAAMEQASININMVATAAEEMNATINEIANNSAKAKNITTQAVDRSHTASQRVDELGRAADEINKVTEVITEISEQTNLLALNATIEAARAGEAGKGFAVVANEIKELAKQTADATLDIKNKIQGIQHATGVTVKEINEINEIIGDVDKIVATIAVAVEEQSAATKEIAENVSQASMGITEVNENVAHSSTAASGIASDIVGVSNSANALSDASLTVKTNAEELKRVADTLKALVDKFKI